MLANDDYFVQLATLLKAELNESIHIYTEFGNEMWLVLLCSNTPCYVTL